MGDSHRIRAEPLSAEAWVPFGWLPLEDTDPEDGKRTLTFEWGDPHVNVIAHAPEEIVHEGDTYRCDALYRHLTHTQVLEVLNCDAVVAVAPAGTDLATPEGRAEIRAFRLHPGDAFVLNQGTWHWGPFPLGSEPVRLFNMQGRRYAEDNDRADLASAGNSVDVVVAG